MCGPGFARLHRGQPATPQVVAPYQVDTASSRDVEFVRENIRKRNPKATIFETAGCARICHVPESIKGRRVLVVEDGPTLTHELLTAFTATRKSLPRKVTKK